MIISILITSFLLDGIISNYVSFNGIFVPLFSLIGLIVSYDFFTLEKKEFYKYAFILGICYDLIYTGTLIFYACLFMLISFVIMHISKVLPSNYFGLIIASLICIVLFRCMTYFFLIVTGNVSFNLNNLYKSIYSSLLINIIYGFIIKFICDLIVSFRLERKKFY